MQSGQSVKVTSSTRTHQQGRLPSTGTEAKPSALRAAIELTGFTEHSNFEGVPFWPSITRRSIKCGSINIKAAIKQPKPVRGSFRGNSESADELISKYRNAQEPSVPCLH
jgi:hypothetical protein